ncbi:helix-turn-helix domain-containing protein [Arthrobacter sp. I2-34]|uniref:Helix-turn-helix domain-containing protein n=1 Tax=Arthrobacter hankyongi TaxID=2904801 RepID=A0ABS9L457_9MICC|nr:IclR family transcriptional regulator C-terminal domain-containing protein [Arthrobacter hankyongi]MCG2621348.1 helix-turn-helix domain-containing protein [Arthrobacter hankyongi]
MPAAARTMALFEIFAREKRELTKSEVARLLDLPESSSSDLLNTLHGLGYLSRTATTRRFYPTGRLLSTARSIAENDVLTPFGVEATGLLADRTGETAAFAIRDGNAIRIVAVTEGNYRLRIVIEIGDTFDLHASALGKAILGQLDDEDMARTLRLKPLSRLAEGTKVDPRQIEDEVRQHRELGWYQTINEGGAGMGSLAVSGKVGDEAVALCIVGPTERVAENLDEYRKLILDVRSTVFENAQ